MPWTVRLIQEEEKPHAEFTSEVAAESQQSAAVVEAVVRAFFNKLEANGTTGRPLRGYLDKFNSIPTAGGNFSSADDSADADSANLTLSFSLTREANSAWRSGVSLQKVGIKGLVVPEIESVVDKATGQQLHYTVGNVLEIRGERLSFDPADVLYGVFLQSVATGTRVRVTVYATVTGGTVQCVIPAGVSGPQRLVVVASVNNARRETIFSEVLTG